jgi:hypothetical protein
MAATALITRVQHVQRAACCSATAHARCLAAVSEINRALLAATKVVLSAHWTPVVKPSAWAPALVHVHPASVLLSSVHPAAAAVLLGRFVERASVLWRARGSASHSLSAI